MRGAEMDELRSGPKVILITGTSTGIGLHAAVELASRGERVFASMRDLTRAEALLRAAAEAGVGVELVNNGQPFGNGFSHQVAGY